MTSKKKEKDYVPGQEGFTDIHRGPNLQPDRGTTDQQGQDSAQGSAEQEERPFSQGVDVGKWLQAGKSKKKMHDSQ